MKQETELYSITEKRTYTLENARLISIGGVFIYATPKGEPLVTKVR